MLHVVYILVVLLLQPSNTSSAHLERYNCSIHRNVSGRIGVIIDRSTRIGKEQEIAMKIAVQDMYRDRCIQLTLHIRDSSETSSPATSIALNLIHKKKVEALLGAFTLPEAAVLSDVLENYLNIPVIFLSPTALIAPSVPLPSANLIQMANNISIHTQCLASLIGYFQWRRVTVIYERSNVFSLDSETISTLSDSLKSADITVEQHLALHPTSSFYNSEYVVEQELRKLSSGRSRVIVVFHSSLELTTCIFRKAQEMTMVEKGFVWIISDQIASLLNSVDSSAIVSMQGVIGYRTNFRDTNKLYKNFKVKFEQSYLAKYPEDQGNPSPSLYALRAYDAILAIGKAREDPEEKFYSTKALLPNLLLSNFMGLSGNISFKNGMLVKLPTFKIINVVGNGYRELAFWSSKYGFSEKTPKQSRRKNYGRNDVKIGPIYWPGGQQTVPSGLRFGASNEKPLRIGVPACGVFPPFVNVSVDKLHNRTFITGHSVDVFRVSLKYLPYNLPFVLVPFYGSYDALVQEIHRKGFDAAVGDINILEERYKWADFSQPYAKSGMVMVVTVKEDKRNEMWMFLKVFDKKMWFLIPSMGLFMGLVVCLIEHSNNPEFADASVFHQVGTIFWFSVTLLFFAQKESPQRNLSKIVLAPWHFLVLMLTIYFTAALTSLMTVSQLSPSVKDIDTLRSEHAAVGCNWNSFLCPYLIDVLQFKVEHTKALRSIDEYHTAFQRGEIKAAFFVTSHANVFLAKYCKGYTIAGPTYYFGGLSFAFPKGSPLSIDMSQAMLKAIEKGEIEMLERELFARYRCSPTSTTNSTSTSVGLKPFCGLFYISGGIASVALLLTVFTTIENRWNISGAIQEVIIRYIHRLSAWMSLIVSRILSGCRSCSG